MRVGVFCYPTRRKRRSSCGELGEVGWFGEGTFVGGLGGCLYTFPREGPMSKRERVAGVGNRGWLHTTSSKKMWVGGACPKTSRGVEKVECATKNKGVIVMPVARIRSILLCALPGSPLLGLPISDPTRWKKGCMVVAPQTLHPQERKRRGEGGGKN